MAGESPTEQQADGGLNPALLARPIGDWPAHWTKPADGKPVPPQQRKAQ